MQAEQELSIDQIAARLDHLRLQMMQNDYTNNPSKMNSIEAEESRLMRRLGQLLMLET
jgi:hypothetical protein